MSDERVDERLAVTNAYGEGVMVDSGWGRITWLEWCKREVRRVNDRGAEKIRIARGNGYVWVTRI